jgi:non-canonical purine NTP pyrophosphatase (RdgB/HAM1 family)
MKKLTFVTKNLNKVADAKKLLPDFEIHHINFDVPEIQSLSTKEIIEFKLKYAYEKVKEPCFVMDAALHFDCLNGFPGPYIKFWYEKTVGAEKTTKIAQLFKQTGCQFRNGLGFFDGKKMKYFEEIVEGNISKKPRGTNGYEWDVIFVPKGETRTFAEMTFEEKQKYAPQKKLLAKLARFLNSR